MKAKILEEQQKKRVREKSQSVLTSQYIETLESEGEADKAAVLIKKLYQSHPDDVIAKYYYGRLLRRSMNYHEALEIFKSLDTKLMMSKIEQIRCLVELGEWEQVLKLCEDCVKQLDDTQDSLAKYIHRVWIYAHKKLGREFLIDRNLSYVEYQIQDYSREKAKKYTQKYYPYEEKARLEELFQQVEQVIPGAEEKRIINYVTFTDTYLYYYLTSKNTVGVLKASTIHNTQDLLFLYPAEHLRRYWYRMIQDDLLLLDDISHKNRPTQVEKFRQKYKKFL